METGKTSKYFKYAIGEIILVVIGILIALQINNWNDNRVNTVKIKKHLSDIVKDLEADTSTIKLQIKFAKQKTIETKKFLALTDYNTLPIDTLERRLETFYTLIPFNKSSFSKIQNSGITNYGKYESIIENLKYYYTVVVADFEDTASANNRAVDLEDKYWRYEQNTYEFTYDKDLLSLESKEIRKEQLVQLLQQPTARNILKIDYRRNKEIVLRLDLWKDIIVKILDETKETIND